MTPKQRAEKVTEMMISNGKVFDWFGMSMVDADEGKAAISMIVQPHHANSHGICHGGITFTLADTAFAHACNSRNQSTLAMHNVISYLAPGKLGDTLTARASEVSLNGKNGIYDVKVSNQEGILIAEFRGMSRAVRGTQFDE